MAPSISSRTVQGAFSALLLVAAVVVAAVFTPHVETPAGNGVVALVFAPTVTAVSTAIGTSSLHLSLRQGLMLAFVRDV